jgi:hypothetical protein
MTCDLCNRRSKRLLCDCCADMVQRLARIDARMKTREVCEAERLAQKQNTPEAAILETK